MKGDEMIDVLEEGSDLFNFLIRRDGYVKTFYLNGVKVCLRPC